MLAGMEQDRCSLKVNTPHKGHFLAPISNEKVDYTCTGSQIFL
jgi:hypothetical protein